LCCFLTEGKEGLFSRRQLGKNAEFDYDGELGIAWSEASAF